MAKETRPITYRVSPEVDAQLRQLAQAYGGVDKALRTLLKLEEQRPYRGPLLKPSEKK